MKLRVKRLREVPLPAYAHPGDAGVDVVNAGGEVTLPPLGRALVPTGLAVEVPVGCELQVRPRSGLALKRGLTVLNSPGTIDAGYRGEVGVILSNLSPETVRIAPGERIAQLVLAPVLTIEWEETAALAASSRHDGGFGSTDESRQMG